MRLASALAIVAFVLTACSVRPEASPAASSGSVVTSASPVPIGAASLPQPTASPSASSAPSIPGDPTRLAAIRLLRSVAADIELTVIKERGPTDPVETLLTGRGRIEPAAGHGHVRYDLTGLLTMPGGSPNPDSLGVVEIIWTDDDVFVRPADATATAWEPRSREAARTLGGLIGRLPDEVIGLVRLLAAAEASEIARRASTVVDGQTADRWTVTVPVEDAAAAGVPADTPDADVLRRVYGRSDVPVEVWLVDGAIRRLGLVLERAVAPNGSPDRTTITYEWQDPGDAVPIEVPG